MPSYQIGIDLGTTTVRVFMPGRGIVFSEPTAITYDDRRKKVVAFGEQSVRMLGRTPPNLHVVFPLSGGVISDYRVAELLIQRVLTKVCGGMLIKPRVAFCIPSAVTEVEHQALEKAARKAGARQVYLMEEPVAAALGIGLDIRRPNGTLVVDIGGGTTDVAVISMNAVVSKSSVKSAGNALDDAIFRYLRNVRGLLIGLRSAEQLKIHHAAAVHPDPDWSVEVKGHSLLTGLPDSLFVTQAELCACMQDELQEIALCVQQALERTPPELAGDIAATGLYLTGGGALLRNIDQYLSEKLGVRVNLPENPQNCVAIGTGQAFAYARQVKKAMGRKKRRKRK